MHFYSLFQDPKTEAVKGDAAYHLKPDTCHAMIGLQLILSEEQGGPELVIR